MSDWKEILADVDDDYLIGLSNKGIVKRAYKDKEEAAAQIESTGGKAVVKVGGETVTVCFPLGESRCTCPSRSVCRHVVQAILVLKDYCLNAEGAGGSRTGEENAENAAVQEVEIEQQEEQQAATDGTAAQQKKETEPAKPVMPEEKISRAGAEKEAGTEKCGEKHQGDKQQKGGEASEVSAKVLKEIREYPQAALKKALGSRYLQAFINQAAAGVKPEIQYSSIVTVHLPEQGFVVKLLSPLEYSACTCHKKELCVHKAAAILWCQLENGMVAKESLLEEAPEVQSFDMEQIREAAGQMKVFLEELFAAGLSRTSPDVLDYMERLAIISHNAGLAKFEGYFRALFDSYDRYFKRKAAFRTEELMGQMTRLYRRVGLLNIISRSGDVRDLVKYAGEFKADYVPAGNLDLIGIAMEHFQSQTGYEGETIYFLEEHTKKWYTYTNARPVFYEPGKRRKYTEKSQAPWGLNISLEDLWKVRLHLTGAKCDDRRRLSSSQDTRGEITGEQGLGMAEIENWYYRDFGKLFLEQIGKLQKDWLFEQSSIQERAELVFVQPASCAKAEFSQTEQKLSLPLFDGAGRELVVEMTYSKNESGAIRYLERMPEKKCPCFLGKIYLRDGRMRMYPVEVWEDFLKEM